jgi:hypothetical protein
MPAKVKKKETGRPRIEIDLKLIMLLSEAGCSVEEMAAMLIRSGVTMTLRTLKKRMAEPEYQEVRELGWLCGNAKLRSNMIRQSLLQNGAGVAMSKFLAANRLGMSDNPTGAVNVNVLNSVNVTTSHDRISARLERGAARLHDRIVALAAAVGASTNTGTIIDGRANDAPADAGSPEGATRA